MPAFARITKDKQGRSPREVRPKDNRRLPRIATSLSQPLDDYILYSLPTRIVNRFREPIRRNEEGLRLLVKTGESALQAML